MLRKGSTNSPGFCCMEELREMGKALQIFVDGDSTLKTGTFAERTDSEDMNRHTDSKALQTGPELPVRDASQTEATLKQASRHGQASMQGQP